MNTVWAHWLGITFWPPVKPSIASQSGWASWTTGLYFLLLSEFFVSRITSTRNPFLSGGCFEITSKFPVSLWTCQWTPNGTIMLCVNYTSSWLDRICRLPFCFLPDFEVKISDFKLHITPSLFYLIVTKRAMHCRIIQLLQQLGILCFAKKHSTGTIAIKCDHISSARARFFSSLVIQSENLCTVVNNNSPVWR